MQLWNGAGLMNQTLHNNSIVLPVSKQFIPSDYDNRKRQSAFTPFNNSEEGPHAYLSPDKLHTLEMLTLKKKSEFEKFYENCILPKNISSFPFFVSGKTGDIIRNPVLRIPLSDIFPKQNNNLFMDSLCRVYKNWQDYLESNKLPEGELCYPKNGVYSEGNEAVEVECGISPAGRTDKKILHYLDIGGRVLVMSATGALIAAVFYPLKVDAGAVAVSTIIGVYDAIRNIQTLVDRYQHHQSIGPVSPEIINCWLGIGGGVMGIFSLVKMVVTAKTAKAVAKMPLTGQIFIHFVDDSWLFLNSVAAANGLINIIIKAVIKEEITDLDVLQFTSAVLSCTHSVISSRQAKSLLNCMRKNSSRGSAADIEAVMEEASEMVELTTPLVIVECSPIVMTYAQGTVSSLAFVCRMVGRKLKEIAEILKRDLKNIDKCMLEGGELLGQFWESWNKEMTEVIDKICRAFHVKHWSELVINGSRCFEFGHIRAMASTLIAEKRSLLDCGSTAVPSDEGQDRQAVHDNSAVMGTDGGPNSLVDGETQTCVSYYDELTKILAEFVEQQICRDPAEFHRYMIFICKFVRSQLQEIKSHYEEPRETIKRFNPVVKKEDIMKEYGMSGNPNNHLLQEVFDLFKNEEKNGFTLLQHAYDSQNADTTAQEEEHGHRYLDTDGVCFYPFYSMQGLASNGMLSEQQYCEMAAEWMGQHADTNSIYVSASGDTAVILVNAAADVIMVRCCLEDGKVSGIGAVLHTASE